METLVIILITIVLLFYIISIYQACLKSFKKTAGEYRSFYNWIANTVGGLLATNIGVYLGIEGTMRVIKSQNVKFDAEIWSIPDVVTMQQYVAIFYAIVMVIVSIVWALLKFDEDPAKTVPILPNMTKALLGIGAAVLAIYLGLG